MQGNTRSQKKRQLFKLLNVSENSRDRDRTVCFVTRAMRSHCLEPFALPWIQNVDLCWLYPKFHVLLMDDVFIYVVHCITQ